MNHSPRIRTVLGCTVLVAALGASATACGSSGHPLSAKPYDAASQISFNGPKGSTKADPDTPLEITTKGDEARITDVTATDAIGRYVAGELSADGRRWHSTVPLAAQTHYTVRVSTEDEDGAPGRKTLDFDTGKAGKEKLLKVTFGPKHGTYGVGEPITAKLNKPIKDKKQRAVVERALKVRSQPAADGGSWYWVDSKTLHYRPKEYWPAHATITVHSNLEGIKVGDRLWGAAAKPLTISTGDRIVAVTDAGAHQMTVYRNGKEINEIPVTTGKPGYETRNGIKVILGKQYYVRMKSSSIGIAAGSSDSYDLPVYYAARVTWSGEYVHAAPWSTGEQGYANVSHGCVGMSTDNASWFFDTVREGDIVKVVNSNGEEMDPFGNGFGDWNLGWKKWSAGSALADAKTPDPALRARLAPEV
ncbi:L,D-transpeptidase [Streptomyces beihaiensis]|uniref:Ig-like domain-containing protein n=1 Tax=Streptomyces beihaiensis TaxID=2984495 RepID=A0ABT3TWJ1_9ACTN|nr:Ig-like domain-containing protein [Streptomyces beihaiensis]MCX3061417.1 Ig-like domain-containing protein [Streptomyces beihaiensis]